MKNIKEENLSTKNIANDVATENVVRKYHEATDSYVNEKSGEITKDINSFFSLVADNASMQIISDAQKNYVENLISNNDPVLEKYIDRLDELSDGMIVSLMQIVLEKIDRGNELINSVIKDKDITNVLNEFQKQQLIEKRKIGFGA